MYFYSIIFYQLATPIEFDGVTKAPICLAESWHEDSHFSRCYITGWGQTVPDRGMHKLMRRMTMNVFIGEMDINMLIRRIVYVNEMNQYVNETNECVKRRINTDMLIRLVDIPYLLG